MATVHEIILLFSKYPVAGRSKTRLIPSLGAEKAAAVQRQMTESVVATIDRFRKNIHCAFEIHHAGGTTADMEQWLGKHYIYRKQADGDLGFRMYSALASHLGRYRSLILVGSDCPAVDETLFKTAVEGLQKKDVVLGPAHDGGYYLIGVRGGMSNRTLMALFQEISWGGGDVLTATLERVRERQLNCKLLRKLHDIDTPDDLRHLDHHSNS